MNPFLNPGPGELELARLTSRMWISFVNDLTPNNHGSMSLEDVDGPLNLST